jgi:hypothetical protein
MEATTFQHTPEGFTLTSGTELYLISDQDIAHLKRGYTIPLRDLDKKSLGPAGVVYTRKGNTEIRLPSGDCLTIPSRLMNAADSIRRVILSPSSSGMVTA